MRWIELIGSLACYFLGYCFYCEDNIGGTVLSAALCAILLLMFLHSTWAGRYTHMSMKKIDKLSGKGFEDYLMIQFRRIGYHVKETDGSHDYGADLLLKKGRERIVVQVKRYQGNVGIAAVQEAVGAVAYYEADRAMVVTNRAFTPSARNLARQNDVELWGREEIRKKFRIPD